jgi:hypothetical protein
MDLTRKELQQMLTDAAEAGARNALIESGHLSPTISKAEAGRLYGRGTVDRWIAEGLVPVIKDGTNSSKIRIDRALIKQVANTSNRASWYNHH